MLPIEAYKDVSLLEKRRICGALLSFPWLLIFRHLDLWGVLSSGLPLLLGRCSNPHKGSFCAQQKAK